MKNKFEECLNKILRENNSLFISTYNGENLPILQKLFVELFNTIPYIYTIDQELHWSSDIHNNEEGIKRILKEEDEENKTMYLSFNSPSPKSTIDKRRTCNKIIETFNNKCFVYKISTYCWIIGPDFIVENGSLILSATERNEKLEKCIVYKEYDYPTMQWVSYDNRGNITTFSMDVIKKGNIEGNYNDDLPHDKISKILNDDSSSIIILHGKPGTGKTNYIRNLIADNQDKCFYWLDSSMFSQINNAEFINFLLDCKHGIFILEDCEILLSDRDRSGNGLLSSLLNISDGILGDSMRLKFICTFNADLQNIDKALLRKGRLKIKYEFKDLCKDKVINIFNNLGIDKSNAKDMPLCEVYNFTEDNGGTQIKNTRKVGFA